MRKTRYEFKRRDTLYYELAYHDYTQKPACPNPTCITSTKTYNAIEHRIYDSFRLKCISKYYTVPLYFDETDMNGYVMGNGWIPNIIVDFDSEYGWVIEFQWEEIFVIILGTKERKEMLSVGIIIKNRNRENVIKITHIKINVILSKTTRISV